jgi:glycogen synthase
MKIFYYAGPGDVIRTLQLWQKGIDDPHEVSIPYSGEFYNLCRAHCWSAIVECDRDDVEPYIVDKIIAIGKRRVLPTAVGGVGYHFYQVLNGLRMTWAAWQAGADVVLVSHGCHWFSLALMRPLGIRVIPILHCTLWPMGHKPLGKVKRLTLRLNGWFWKNIASATVGVSSECERQVREICATPRGPIFTGLAQYRRETFKGVKPPPPWEKDPFRIMYAGRITREKGVVNLIEIAAAVKRRIRRAILFEICGDGPDLPLVRDHISALNLDNVVFCHGKLDRFQMQAVYSRAHLVVVTTTSHFPEGFCMTAAEAVLSRRPLIASRLVPALDVLGPVVYQVPEDNLEAFIDGIVLLASDYKAWAIRQAATEKYREQFFDGKYSWKRAVEQAILNDEIHQSSISREASANSSQAREN